MYLMLYLMTGIVLYNKVAPSLAIEPMIAPVRERTDISNTIEALTRKPNGGLIVPGDTYVDIADVRKIIVELAATNRIPALYTNPGFVRDGGLMSYSTDIIDQYRGAASYVARILNEKCRVTFRCNSRRNLSWRSTSRRPNRWASIVPFGLLNAADEVIE